MTGVVIIIRCYNVIVNIMEINTFLVISQGKIKAKRFCQKRKFT